MTKISLCILTYRRIAELTTCLNSLAAMHMPADIELVVTVIENDVAQLARPAVENFAETVPFSVNYVCEPQRGIPVARNTAIAISHDLDADYIAFIDDDEWVDTAWLENLLNYCQRMGGNAVISGDVIPVFPQETPPHIAGLIKNKQRPTGMELSACATNNVLFPITLTRQLNLRFDTSVPLAGGTDTKFFTEATSKGVKIYKCAEAVVYEAIPPSRANIQWFSKRKYRAGITETWRNRRMGKSRAHIFLSAVLKILINGIQYLFYLLINRKLKRNAAWLKCCKAAGKLAGLAGVQVESYLTTT